MPDDKARLELPVDLADCIRRELAEGLNGSPSALLLEDQKINAAFFAAIENLCKTQYEISKEEVHKFADGQAQIAAAAIAAKLRELGEAALKERFDAASKELAKEVIGELQKEAGQLDLDEESIKTQVLSEVRKNLGPQASAGAFNHASHGELAVSEPIPRWREENGVIYFFVTSDGTPGEEWIERLEGKGSRVSDYAKRVLRSPDFKPTNGVITEIAVLKGVLFLDENRITKKIRAEADRRKLLKPNAEAACLIREKFTDEEIEAMGFWWIVVMHEPIKDSGGSPYLLYAYRFGRGRWLVAYCDGPGDRWFREDGFAFAVSQV